jgi:hypothetical protein
MSTPAAPTIMGLVSRDKSVYLNWTVPSMGDSEIVDYVVQRKLANEPDSCFAIVEAVSKSDLSVPGATISGCNGLDYVFKVAAKNKFGVGEYSASSSIITPSAVPSKPAAPTCIPGDRQITINWSAPANGGSPITDYVIQFRRQAADSANFYTTRGGGTINDGVSTATTYTHTGLTNGGIYGYRIAAKNATGQSVWSTGTPIVVPATGPQAPGFLILRPYSGYVNLSWIPQGNGGSPITGYVVQRKLASQPDSSFAFAYEGRGTPSGSRVTVNIAGLVNGTAYVFRVAAKNARGVGPYTPSSSPITPASVPAAMSPPTCTPGNAQITLNWTAPNNGGSPITDYVIQSQTWPAGWAAPQPAANTIVDGVSANTNFVSLNMRNGWRYRFRIWAKNAVGAGSASAFSAWIIPTLVAPSAPTNLTASLVGNTSVRLNFTPPTGSGTITGYVVVASTAGEWAVIDGNYQINGLISGLSDGPHTFVIAAKNSAGVGTYSAESNSVTTLNRLFDKSSFAVVDEPYRTWLNKAADRWDRYIKYNAAARATIASENPGWNGLRLNEYYLYSDSTNNEIAATSLYGFKDLGGKKYNSISFYLQVNDHWNGLYLEKDWINILTHELGHALGIGFFWGGFTDWDLFFPGATPPSNFFLNGTVYTNAQAAYNTITSLSRSRIPLENTGGGGTASGHWDDTFRPATATGSLGVSYPGLRNEMMVGYFTKGANFVLSRLTIKTLVDFGWEEITPGASEGNPGLVLSASAGFASETAVVHKCGFETIKNKIIPQKIGTVGLTVDIEPTTVVDPDPTPDSTVE